MRRPPAVLNLVLSVSAPGLLREGLRAAGREELVVGFRDCLALGPINPPAPGRRARWFAREFPTAPGDWSWLPQSVHGFWRAALAPGLRTVVWTSSRSAEEHAAFLACVERLGEQHYEVIDLADVEIDIPFSDGRTRREKAISLARVGPGAIAREHLWDLARPLKSAERRKHLTDWRRLKNEDAPLRIIDAAGLKSAPISHFDEALVDCASTAWQSTSSVIAKATTLGSDDFCQVGYPLLEARTSALVASGSLQGRGRADGPPWMSAEVRRRP